MKRMDLSYPETENSERLENNNNNNSIIAVGNVFKPKKYFMDILSNIEIWVYPNDVQVEILPSGKQQYFTIENNERVDLYPSFKVVELQKILSQFQNENTSSLKKREKYFLSISGRATIWASPDDVQRDTSTERNGQLFINVNNKKIYVHPASQVELAREIILSQNKKQVKRSSATSKVHLSASSTANRLQARSVPANAGIQTTQSLNNSKPRANWTYKELKSFLFDKAPGETPQQQHISRPKTDWTYKELDSFLFDKAPDETPQQPNIMDPEHLHERLCDSNLTSTSNNNPDNMNLDEQVNFDDLNSDWVSAILEEDMLDQKDQQHLKK